MELFILRLKEYFLSNPEIGFKYSNSKKTIYNLLGKKLFDRIGDIFGSEYKESLIPVNYSRENYSISGYIGNINLARKRIGDQLTIAHCGCAGTGGRNSVTEREKRYLN